MRRQTRILCATALTPLLLLASGNSLAADEPRPYVTTRILSAALANKIATTALAECSRKGYQVSVAVTDRSGQLLAFARDPLAGPHTITVSQRKAYTAATYQTSTADMVNRQELRFTPRVILLGGGLPIRVGGQFYGAVGVSGAPREKTSGDLDEACARAGINAVQEQLEFAE
jgi:uncharacterized protein GlcG (DUF336 family)